MRYLILLIFLLAAGCAAKGDGPPDPSEKYEYAVERDSLFARDSLGGRLHVGTQLSLVRLQMGGAERVTQVRVAATDSQAVDSTMRELRRLVEAYFDPTP